MSREVVLVAYGRSALCRARKGSFAKTHPIEWAAQTLQGVLKQVPQLDPKEIGDVVVGNAMSINETAMNIGRLIVNRAGLPDDVCAQTINRFCSAGLQAIATAHNSIAAGQMDVAIGGGLEDMSKTFNGYSEDWMDPWFADNYIGGYMSMGETAERVAEKYNVSREEMEQLAVESHAKALKAQESGDLNTSIIPVTVKDENGNDKVVTLDEGIRPGTSMESLAGLKTCFRPDGRVTAATSSQTTDGAAFAVLMTAEKAKELGIKPIAKLVGFQVAGCDSTMMGLGPMYAVPKVMKQTGMTVDQMDVIELNEAFAAQAIPCMNELKMDKSKVNPWGGAMALGHPLGGTGAILTCKALDYLKINGGKYALVTMCIGGGMGGAGIWEML